MSARRGFVIPLTLMLIAVAIVLVTGIYQRGSVFVPFISTVQQRDQAKQLALSGIQVALCQLATPVETIEQKGATVSKESAQPTMQEQGSIKFFQQFSRF
jgi:type II secretory pathway component PulK